MMNVLKACIILHNMIVEARRGSYECNMAALQQTEDAQRFFNNGVQFKWNSKSVKKSSLQTAFSEQMWAGMVNRRIEDVTDEYDHFRLKHQLIEHIWARRSEFI